MFHVQKPNVRKRKATCIENESNATMKEYCYMQDDLRITKKINGISSYLSSFVNFDEMIIFYIQKGIEYFYQDNFVLADDMFWKSLALALKRYQQSALYNVKKAICIQKNVQQNIPKFTATPITNEIRDTCEKQHAVDVEDQNHKQRQHDKLLKPHVDTSYDEGFCNDSKYPIQIKYYTTTKFIEVAVILFNLGQIQMKKEQYSQALIFFNMAYESCCNNHYSKSESKDEKKCYSIAVDELYYKILQAKAYCCYRKSYYVEAIVYLETSLKHIDNNHKYYQASTRNSIAVAMLAHSSIKSINQNKIELTCSRGLLSTKMFSLFQESLLIYESIAIRSDKNGNNQVRRMKMEISTVFNNMGRAYYSNGELDKAVTSFENALQIRRLPENQCNQTDLVVTICNLGQVYHQIGKLDDAMILYQEFLEYAIISEQSNNNMNQCGPGIRFNPSDVAVIALQMASIHLDNGKLQNARTFLETSLSFNRLARNFMKNLESASVLNKLASVCYKLNDREASLRYLQEGLLVEQEIYSQYHANVLVTILNIAQIYRDMNNYSEAFHYYNIARDIQTKINSNQNQNNSHVKSTQSNVLALSSIFFSMALMKNKMKSYPLAFEYYQKALCLQRQHYGYDFDHHEIASTLNSTGIVLFHWGKMHLSRQYFEQSLIMRKNLFGWHHPDVAINLYNLATLHMELGNDVLATSLYKETLIVECHTMGKNSRDVVQTLQHLGLIYQQRGELNEALFYFSQSLDIERRRAKDSKSDIAIAKTLNLIGNIHLQRGHVHEMMECFVEATRIYMKHNTAIEISGYNFYGISKLHPECAEVA